MKYIRKRAKIIIVSVILLVMVVCLIHQFWGRSMYLQSGLYINKPLVKVSFIEKISLQNKLDSLHEEVEEKFLIGIPNRIIVSSGSKEVYYDIYGYYIRKIVMNGEIIEFRRCYMIDSNTFEYYDSLFNKKFK